MMSNCLLRFVGGDQILDETNSLMLFNSCFVAVSALDTFAIGAIDYDRSRAF